MTNIVQFPAAQGDIDSDADVVPALRTMIKDLEMMVTKVNSGLINGDLRDNELRAARTMRDQFTPVIAELQAIGWDPKWAVFSDKATASLDDLVRLIDRAEASGVSAPHVQFRANASQEYRDGYHARMSGTPRNYSPYACRDPRNARWQKGWWKADAEPSAPNVVYPPPPATTVDDWIRIVLGVMVFFAIAIIGAANSWGHEPGRRPQVPVVIEASPNFDACSGNGVVEGLDPSGDGFLAVRSGPGPEYAEIDQLYNGEEVYLCTREGKWLGVVSNQRQHCNVTRPWNSTRPYTGPCKSGWVHEKWVRFYAG
ncbi:hypothetical protein GOC22_15680 [Sinorhizobium meliloti]|nr:hypothetical protein [Sinorhizobium meliloti]